MDCSKEWNVLKNGMFWILECYEEWNLLKNGIFRIIEYSEEGYVLNIGMFWRLECSEEWFPASLSPVTWMSARADFISFFFLLYNKVELNKLNTAFKISIFFLTIFKQFLSIFFRFYVISYHKNLAILFMEYCAVIDH